MNKEKLDTLLRSKLQWHESEVQEAELKAVLSAMGVTRKKKSFLPYFGLAVLVLAISFGLFVTFSDHSNGKLNPSLTESTGAAGKSDPLFVPDNAPNTEMNTASNEIEKHIKPDVSDSKTVHAEKEKSTGIKPAFTSLPRDIDNSYGRSGSADYPGFAMPASDFSASGVEENTGRYSLLADIEHFPVEINDEGIAGSKVNIQNDNKSYEESKSSKFKNLMTKLGPEFGIWIAPALSFESSNLKAGSEEKVHMDYMTLKDKSERPLFSVNTGFEFQFRLMPFLNFSSGVAYFSTGNSYDYDYAINKIPVIDSATNIIKAYITLPDSNAAKIKSRGRHVVSYVELPFRFRFTVYKSPTIRIGVEPAYTFQFLSSEKGEKMDPVSMQLTAFKSYKSLSGNLQLAVPFSFDLKNKFGYSITPFAGRAVGNVYNGADLNTYRLYTGIRMSLNYRLQ